MRYRDSWRDEFLERTWQALALANPLHHAALLLRVEVPDLSSAEMAQRLSEELGKPVSAELARKALQRAHAKFAELLVEEVADSLESCSSQELQQELRELDLLKYCQSAVEKRQRNCER